MSRIIFIDEVSGEADNGMFKTPQAVAQLLSDMRRRVTASAERMEKINKGHEITTTVTVDPDMRRAMVRTESTG